MTSWLTYNSTEGATPRQAAVVILYDETGGSVLFVRRNQALAFMGGHHAFPGGRVSRYDTGARVHNAADDETARYLTAAVREVFEETGVLLARGADRPHDSSDRMRREIIRDPERFEPLLEAGDFFIDAAEFAPAGRWITPSFSPMRFDTRYFLYRCDGPLPVSPMGRDEEITEVCWLTPQQALEKRGLGELTLSTPPAFVLQRLATFPLREALERLGQTPGFSDTLIDYIEPAPGIHIVPVKAHTLPPATHTNCVIIGETELAIIDPGVQDEAEQKRFSLHLDDICEGVGGRPAAILLTHTHPDHSSFAAGLSGRYGIPIHAHPESLAQFPGGRPLRDGAYLELAGVRPWRIRCLHTPGHHPGHLCFFEGTTRTLVCGDMVANPGTIIIDPDAGGDMDVYLKSLERLSGLEPALTVPGHGAPLIHAGGPALFRKTMEHRLMREEKVKKALDAGACSMEDLLSLAYDDTPAELHPLAERQLRAHLKRLGRQYHPSRHEDPCL